MDIMKRICEQAPYTDKVRRSRWAIVRNTYRELIDTTMRTFFDWIPESLGTLRKIDMEFTMSFGLKDGTRVEAEILFRALDKPQDVKKLLSLELTGVWLNEAREIPKQVLDMAQGRVGRYPNKRQGGPSWWGVIADTNPPDSDHWFYTLFEETAPENHVIFHQPSGISPAAENIENLPPNYYKNMMAGKDQEWINVYVHGQYGFVSDGKPIFPEYRDDFHHTSEPISLLDHLYVGIDFGLTPAAVILQKTPSGQVQVIDELCTFDMGAVSFGKLLFEKLSAPEYKDKKFEIYADPAGEQRSQSDETTPFQILWKQGIEAWPTYTNDFTIRREVVAESLMRLDFKGSPGFILGPKAKMLRKGLSGGYKYKRLQVSGENRFQDRPDKNRYSHVCEALQYAMLGAFGDDKIIGGYGNQTIDYSNLNRMTV
jgi:hypothetical protein